MSPSGTQGMNVIVQPSLPHLHAVELPTPFPVGPITVYLASAPGEPLTLVDTGPRTPETRAALDAGLAGLGHAVADLARIVVTHAHADHFGLAGDLVDGSGAQVWTHPWSVPTLGDYDADRQRRVAFFGGLLRQAAVPSQIMQAVGWVTQGMQHFAHPVAVDATLDEGDRLRLAGCDWLVLHTPGHAAGLICLYEPASRTLLSSDHLLADISSNPVMEPPPPGQTERPRSLALYRASLQRVAEMDITRALPSHGRPVRDVAGLVGRRLAFHERRLERVLDALRHGARTTWDVTQVLFPDRSPLDTFLAVSEVLAHLDLLEIEGRILGEETDGVVYWRRVPEA
jgi:glyoxylase-like metal-dependent hydrolase (beta-lactamase superfamily II)